MELVSSQYQIEESPFPGRKKCVLDVHEVYQITEQELAAGGIPLDQWFLKDRKKHLLDMAWEHNPGLTDFLPAHDDAYVLRITPEGDNCLRFSAREG